MISWTYRSSWLSAAIFLSSLAALSAQAENSEAEHTALAASFGEAKIALGDGLTASEREGKPISAKFETEDGKLQLSVYTAKSDGFLEVIVDPKTGAITKAEKITDADDLAAAAAQKAAMEKARVSLRAAIEQSVKSNPGYRAISVTAKVVEGRPAADVTLLQGATFKMATEKLD